MSTLPTSARPRPPVRNRLLARLSKETYDRLAPDLQELHLAQHTVLHEPGDEIRYVYFLGDGVISLINLLSDGTSVEVGVIGNDGVLGSGVAMGDGLAMNRAIVQIGDGTLRLSVGAFNTELRRGGELQSFVLLYARFLTKQTMQTATCNSRHALEERLARWLLVCHDRVAGDELRLTQEFIAQMLGVRRSGVTVTAGLLQAAGLIEYRRGQITIVNRSGLEQRACECYRVVRDEYERLLG